jgi:hypothetical protein
LPPDVVDLARVYRYRHGWILLDPRAVKERRKLRGMENAEEVKAGVRPGGKRAPAAARPAGTVRFRHAEALRETRPVTGRRNMQLRENAEIARARRSAHAKLARRSLILSTELATRHVPVDPKIPLGSGGRFKKLKSRLAARGARNPGALAAYIGRRAYGRKKFASLGAHGRAHAHATSTGPALEFSMTHLPVNSPFDLVISRSDAGTAVIRHRNGGDELGQIRRDGRGWVATIGGKDQPQRTHQRSALADVIGVHNKSALTSRHRPASAGEPLQPAPRQTQLMEAYGIPAIRALATPMTGASSGPRVTDRDGDGLSAKGRAIHGRLKKRGFPPDRAVQFARRAQNMKRRG